MTLHALFGEHYDMQMLKTDMQMSKGTFVQWGVYFARGHANLSGSLGYHDHSVTTIEERQKG